MHDSTEHAPPHRIRRRVVLALAVILLLLAAALVPPLVNLNRLQHRIATSISQSLGRPVHIDPPVTFHIFPMPGFTLHNLVVSEDPAFGNEPTIRCMNVRAQLRLASLWRHQVEFSHISFLPDENGIGASLNIVRLPDGRNNLQAILMRASQIDAAPTVQTKAGPQPRFPYIEAKGARVNFKLGDEKTPFSLTDAELALWLPNAHEWRFQLKSHPSRTDTDTADTGILRAEGSIKTGSSLPDAPINLSASWHDAPLGEASTLVRGADAGWRGTVNIDTTTTGTLGHATLAARLTLNDLRRADFVPAHPLDLSVSCTAGGNLAAAALATTHCDLPRGAANQGWTLDATGVDLNRFTAQQTTVHGNIPLAALFGWFKVLSPHTPQEEEPAGTVEATFSREAAAPWTGDAHATIAVRPELQLNTDNTLIVPFTLADTGDGCTSGLALAPTPIPLDKEHTATFSGDITRCGYSFRASGTATPQSLLDLGTKLPTLAEGLKEALPKSEAAVPIDVTCTRTWFQPQTCTAEAPTPAPKRRRRR